MRKFTWQVGKNWRIGCILDCFPPQSFGVIFYCRFQQSICPMVFCALIFRWTQKSGWVYRMYLEGGPSEWWTGVMDPITPFIPIGIGAETLCCFYWWFWASICWRTSQRFCWRKSSLEVKDHSKRTVCWNCWLYTLTKTIGLYGKNLSNNIKH